jgi:hypothetical protein
MFMRELVTLEANAIDLVRGDVLEGEDLGYVSASFDVWPSWTMARFASVPFAGGGLQSGFPVGAGFKALVNVFVTSLTCISPNELA